MKVLEYIRSIDGIKSQQLIGKMLEYGKLHGTTEAYAIISDDNIASQSLFKNHNFDRVSEWEYYNIHVHHKTYQNRNKKNKNTTRVASCDDIDNVWDYLTFSENTNFQEGDTSTRGGGIHLTTKE